MAVTQAQVNGALALLLRHVRRAPTVHFGDTRERSASIRHSVHRLSNENLEKQYEILRILSYGDLYTMIPREKRRDLYDVGHEIRSEYWDRQRQIQRAKDQAEKGN